jgi:Rrf2 family transcriptional regulator, nitric oxide-sensitive transcriptional repressor
MAGLFKISEAASLALHTLVMMAHETSRTWTVPEIAKALGGSEAHLYKVLQRLRKAGLTSSTRGPSGGYKLARPGEEISLLEVYEAIDGPIGKTTCLLGHPACNGTTCMFGDLIERTNSDIRQYLAGLKISDAPLGFEGVQNETENR